MVNLVGYKATVVIFDLNGEYTSLGMTNDGKRNMYYDKITRLTPRQNFKVALEQLHLNTVMGILVNALHLPGTSAREFRRLWKMLKEQGKLTLQTLGEAIRDLNCNQHVKDALASRFHSLVNSASSLTPQAKRRCLMRPCKNKRSRRRNRSKPQKHIKHRPPNRCRIRSR